MNSYVPEIHGDGFKPYETLEPYSRTLDGVFFFDSEVSTGKPTLVLVHGNGDEAETWRHIFQPLTKSFRVLALDLPGFGRSLPLQNGDLDSLTAGLSRFLNDFKLSKMHLVGSSLGAFIAANYANQEPDHVSSLTLVGGVAAGFGEIEVSPSIQSLLEPGIGENYYNGLRSLGQDAAFGTLEPYYANLQAMPKIDLEFLRERVWARVWSDTQRDAFLAALRSLFSPDSKIISKLDKLPLQLIWGANDNIVPVQAALAMQKAIPQAKLEVIQAAGHLPHQEQPEAFLKVLEGFLSNLEAKL